MHFFLKIAGLVVVIAATAFGSAQTLEFGLSGSSALEVQPRLELRGLEIDDFSLNARLVGGITDPLKVGAGLMRSINLGPVGTAVLHAKADLDSNADYQLGLAANGVIGSIAGRANLEGFNVNPGHFDPLAPYSAQQRPRLPGLALSRRPGLWLRLGGDYRIDRTTILGIDSSLTYLKDFGFGTHLSSRLQLRRIIEKDDLSLLAEGDLAPGATGRFAAFGLSYKLNRPDLPVTEASLWVGGGSEGWWPGLRLSVLERNLADTVDLTLSLLAEPYRNDVLPYRGLLNLSFPVDPVTLSVDLAASYDRLSFVGLAGLKVSHKF